MLLKICGLQRNEDVDAVNESHVDYAGLIFAKSKRYVSPRKAKKLVSKLDKYAVGVFVNEKIEVVIDIVQKVKLDVVQLHGDEDQTYINELTQYLSIPIWKALRVQSKKDLIHLSMQHIQYFVLDAYHPTTYGGLGKKFDYTLLEGIDLSHVFIAGGVSIEDVDRIKQLKACGIDVSSSVEVNGYKDKNKIKELGEKIR